jgi:hypothetical protein|tara:strand:- start:1979 stop:2572 length:594 start_codon:yes stop_codon:yes gene_type:complete
MTTRRPSYFGPTKVEDCPAIIFNNSGSMAAIGRVEKSFEIIKDVGRNSSFDLYVNDARTGIPDFVAHIESIRHGTLNPPLLPLVSGEDYMNPLALAAIIQEYNSVHIIDDGEASAFLWNALEILDNIGFDERRSITLYIIRSQKEYRGVDNQFKWLSSKFPQAFDGTGNTEIMVYHAIPKAPHESTEWQRDRLLFIE